MKSNIKAIIFDLGNVLIGFDHRIAVSKILRHTPKSTCEIYDLFFDSEWTREFEKGKIMPLEFFQKVKSSLSLSLGYEEFLPIWNEIFFAKPESEKFVGSLDSGLKLLMLSNVNKLHYQYLRGTFSSAFNLFEPDKIIPSCETGFIKPAKEIYDLALLRSGVAREDVIYVDDRQDLVEAACSYGLKSIQFQDVDKLRREFLSLGIFPGAKVNV